MEFSNIVVYHLVPTSNHNYNKKIVPASLLFIILFLHQTTTPMEKAPISRRLFIILFLHQTTTNALRPILEWKLFIILFLHQTTTYSRKSTGNQQDTSFWASKKWPCRTIPTANLLKKI